MNEVIMVSIWVFGAMVIFSSLAAAIGFAILGSRFLDTIARQPEIAPLLQTKMFIVAGLLDALPIIGVGLALMLAYANPFIAFVQ